MGDVAALVDALMAHSTVLGVLLIICIILCLLFLWLLSKIIATAVNNGVRKSDAREILAEISWKLDMLNKLDELNTSRRHSFAEEVMDTLNEISRNLEKRLETEGSANAEVHGRLKAAVQSLSSEADDESGKRPRQGT